jgi:hypothetical protein
MGYSRESLNSAICLKLTDIDQASGLHKAMFGTTQLAGAVGFAGAVLIAPLALEVGAIAAVAGAVCYGISQLVQTKRTGHFLPLPLVPLSGAQLTHGISRAVSGLMGSDAPPEPESVRLLPTDWLPERERRVNYLLTHCPDLLINAAENAQAGISFAAIVDTAVRASEYAITDDQLSNPITGLKLAPEVRKVLTGDTSTLEAQQAKAIAQEYQRAQTALAAGELTADEFAAITAQVAELAPDVIDVVALPAGDDTPSAQPATATAAGDESPRWDELLAEAMTYPVISLVGSQGSYKTTLLNYLVGLTQAYVIVFDPHAKKSDWAGCNVIGRGMCYSDINEALSHAKALTQARYTARAEEDLEDFEPVVYVAEELTNWTEHVPNAGKFFKSTLSDFRKANQQLIKVSHALTNAGQGGGSGMAATREAGEVLIKLIKPRAGQPGHGSIRFPGEEPINFEFPDLRPLTRTYAAKQPPADLRKIAMGHATQNSIDVSSVPSSPAAVVTAQPSQWDLCKAHTTIAGLKDLMTWIESTSKDTFSPADARNNKQLRAKLPDPSTEAIRAMFIYLEVNGFLVDIGDEVYQLSQGQHQ